MINVINWAKIWRKTYRTMAETAIGLIPTSLLITEINWKLILSAVILSGVVTFLAGIVDSDNVDDLDEWDDPEDEEMLP